MRKFVVTGGRDYGVTKKGGNPRLDRGLAVVAELERSVVVFAVREMLLAGFDTMIVGDAPGADALAAAEGRALKMDVRVYKANWQDLKLSAGPIRNQQMIDSEDPEVCLAFPGGRGTADMRRRCKAAGITLREVKRTR